MNEWINDFAKRKGNITPAARGDMKWRNEHMSINLAGDTWEMGLI